MSRWAGLLSALVASAMDPTTDSNRAAGPEVRPKAKKPIPNGWLTDPRSAVLLVLGAAILGGGGRKLLHGWQARRAVARLEDADISAADIARAAEFGRPGLMELFRILGTANTAELRDVAGHALASLWARDELVREEEQALVRRGFVATWQARRRYPRALQTPIPIAVSYGVPFLRETAGEVGPGQLEWSHRIMGARRATLEQPSPWKSGPALAEFTIVPSDFPTSGPHRLVLQAKVRTVELTGHWEMELPHIPFVFEFDSQLVPRSLFGMADEARGDAVRRSVRLEAVSHRDPEPATFLELAPDMAIRNPPRLRVATPLPCDLAHSVAIEIEGRAERIPAANALVSGQADVAGSHSPGSDAVIPLGPVPTVWPSGILSPGPARLRAWLTPAPDLGWGAPNIRSIWPETIETGWIDVEIVRK